MARMTPPIQALIDRLDRLPKRGENLGVDLRKALIAADSDSVSCAIRARRVVEYVVRDVHDRRIGKPSGTQPLEGVLARLVKEGHFPGELAGFVGAVKGLANRLAHDPDSTYTVGYLVSILDQTLLVLEWYFEHELPPGQTEPTTVETPVASPKPEATAPDPAPAAPAAVEPEPEPGRRTLVQLAVQGKRFSMSCSMALTLLVMMPVALFWAIPNLVGPRRPPGMEGMGEPIVPPRVEENLSALKERAPDLRTAILAVEMAKRNMIRDRLARLRREADLRRGMEPGFHRGSDDYDDLFFNMAVEWFVIDCLEE
jgi:hypothetical protein